MLGRRELSEAQVRERLARHGHPREDIDDAVTRLKEERAIDDARVAEAIARTQTSVKHRGKVRVKLQLQRAGISPEIAGHALDEIFSGLNDDALIEAALGRRLKADRLIEDDREFQRLYRYLVGQGFESSRVLKTLSGRRRGR